MPLRLGQEIQEVLRPQLTNRHRPGLLADAPIPWSNPKEEIYDFDWTVLRNQKDRFEKINFDAIPC